MVQDNTNSGVFVTVVDIIGSGIVHRLGLRAMDNTCEVKITIDGYTETLVVIGTVYRWIYFDVDPLTADIFRLGNTYTPPQLPFWFKNGFKYEHRKVLGSRIYSQVIHGDD